MHLNCPALSRDGMGEKERKVFPVRGNGSTRNRVPSKAHQQHSCCSGRRRTGCLYLSLVLRTQRHQAPFLSHHPYLLLTPEGPKEPPNPRLIKTEQWQHKGTKPECLLPLPWSWAPSLHPFLQPRSGPCKDGATVILSHHTAVLAASTPAVTAWDQG